jgi:hypothetical protein
MKENKKERKMKDNFFMRWKTTAGIKPRTKSSLVLGCHIAEQMFDG